MSTHARELVLGLLHPNPKERLGASTAGGPATVRERAFFREADPPIDFDSIFTLPPPPLVPPPPMPSIEGDTVINTQLAARRPLCSADRQTLASVQGATRWAPFLDDGAEELIVLASTVIKRKGIFSAKRRQLILVDGNKGSRICYVDPGENGAVAGSSDVCTFMPLGALCPDAASVVCSSCFICLFRLLPYNVRHPLASQYHWSSRATSLGAHSFTRRLLHVVTLKSTSPDVRTFWKMPPAIVCAAYEENPALSVHECVAQDLPALSDRLCHLHRIGTRAHRINGRIVGPDYQQLASLCKGARHGDTRRG